MFTAETASAARRKTLCFSGHRAYMPSSCDTERLFDAVREAWDAGYRTFVSGMAPGFDLAAAEAVVRLRAEVAGETSVADGREAVRLVAALPFRGQARGYTAVDGARYDALLAAACEVNTLSDRYFHGCYYRRDEWMVERSGRVVCWLDPARGASGTRYTVRRALTAGLEVVNLFRDSAGSLF